MAIQWMANFDISMENLSSFPFLFALKTRINFMLKRKYGLEKDVKCMTIVGIRF